MMGSVRLSKVWPATVAARMGVPTSVGESCCSTGRRVDCSYTAKMTEMSSTTAGISRNRELGKKQVAISPGPRSSSRSELVSASALSAPREQ